MITVHSVKPHHAGFGMFDRSTDCASYPDVDTVSDYLDMVRDANPEAEQLAPMDPRIKDADGKIYNQGEGELIGWEIDGIISLELVYES